MKLPQLTTIVSVIALVVSCGSFVVAKLSYDLSAAKDEREIRDKRPAVDVQIRPAGASSASVVISIINRADINIAPLEITVEHSFEAGELYLSSAQQSMDKLLSSLSLQAMGTIAPKGIGTLKATPRILISTWLHSGPIPILIRPRYANRHRSRSCRSSARPSSRGATTSIRRRSASYGAALDKLGADPAFQAWQAKRAKSRAGPTAPPIGA